MVVDFNIIIQIVTTDPKNETTTVDKKASVVQTTIKEAKDGFVGRLKASKVIPKSKCAVVKLGIYMFFLTLLSGIRYFSVFFSYYASFHPEAWICMNGW